ncbi:MAG TPA: iron ABC transporter permease [Usitatibacteraceae bacterium]|nr:iron ABC transporter permease [Usitatibacteraceae bacterium]HRA23083.1 iron ABC transporter permease [Usitatibacteraceae bacterium]
MILDRARFPLWLAVACAALVALVAWSLSVGRFPVSPGEVWRALWSAVTGGESGLARNVESVILQVRAPRLVAALAVGAALAAAGAAYQNLFKNPLVSPDILGVSAGCALGAGLAILFALPIVAIQGLAFVGGIAAVALVVAVGTWVGRRDPILTLILAGVVVGSLFGAGIALVKYVADPYNQLPAITFWLLGSFGGALPADLAVALPVVALGLVPLVLLRWRIDLLALSEDEARSLGLDVTRLRFVVIACATLVTASAVAIAGVIGWVGLVIPHAARLLVGASFARVMPLSLVLGAAFMLAVDTLCRTVAATEIPPGVATAFVGTPVFIALLAATFRR